jgi:3-hydroxy acid dehydrogenase / malonic semialdehyde reductase
MVNLQGQLALITGASSGIGEACARQFGAAGARLILNARRQERLHPLAAELQQSYGCEVLVLPFDVRDRPSVESALLNLPSSWQSINLLINNAGLSRGFDKLQDGNIEDWEEMIDTNVKGLLYVSRAVIPGMVARGHGHIVNVGSIAGRQTYPAGNVYCASKAAVKALSEGLKMDLLGTPVRVSEIQPGLVNTEFSTVRFHGDRPRADAVYQGLTPLSGGDIAEIILFMVTRPAHVNISELLVVPTDQATPTLVHRRPSTLGPEAKTDGQLG